MKPTNQPISSGEKLGAEAVVAAGNSNAGTMVEVGIISVNDVFTSSFLAYTVLNNEYTLNCDGKEKGMKSRHRTMPHNIKKVFLGSLLMANARIIITATIIIEAEKLICHRFIDFTSFQIIYNFFELLNLICGQVFSSK
ncbi:hypothetical protein D3C73_894800 [compost metagenome]